MAQQQQQPKADRKRVEELARLLFVQRTAAGVSGHTVEHTATKCVADATEFYRVWDAQTT